MSLSVSETKLEFESKIDLLRQESRRASIECQRAGEMSAMTTNAIRSLDEIIEIQSSSHRQGDNDNNNDESDDDDDDDDTDDDIDDDVNNYDEGSLAKGEYGEIKGSNDNEGIKRIAKYDRVIPDVKEGISSSSENKIKCDNANIAEVDHVSNPTSHGNTSKVVTNSKAAAQDNSRNISERIILPPLHSTSSFVHTPRKPLALLDLALQKGYLGKFRSTSLSVLTNKEDVPIGKLSKKNRSTSLQSQFTSINNERIEKEIVKSKEIKKERKKDEQTENEEDGGKGNLKDKSNEKNSFDTNIKNLNKIKVPGSSSGVYHRGRKASTLIQDGTSSPKPIELLS